MVEQRSDEKRIIWARAVSDILSPPAVWAVLAFPIALRDAASLGQALLWAAIYGVLVCLIPVLYIAWMVWRGEITDIHMRVRQQRFRPFIVSLVCTTVAWWTLRLLGAPPVVPQFVLFTLIQLAIVAVVTLGWQISIHAMSISGALVAVAWLYGLGAALLFFPLVPLVGAARITLKRHTLAQVLAGTVVGVVVAMIMVVSVV